MPLIELANAKAKAEEPEVNGIKDAEQTNNGTEIANQRGRKPAEILRKGYCDGVEGSPPA